MKKKIYISIPITGLDYATQQQLAATHQQVLESEGYEVVNPFELTPEQGKTDAYYMGRCIEALLQCDAILMCDGWMNSKGCRTELFAAEQYGIPQISYTKLK